MDDPRRQALRRCRASCGAIRRARRPVFLVLTAHFRDGLRELEKSIEPTLMRNPRALVCLAGSLEEDLPRKLSLNASSTGMILVAERHPLRSRDALIETFAESLPCPCHITHPLSLEDAVLRGLRGERIRSLLEHLGMQPSESISAASISRVVRSSQKKIEKNATGDHVAYSADEWFQYNYPDIPPPAQKTF